MSRHPRDWIAWSVAVAIVIVAAVELFSTAHASRVSSIAEDGGRPAASELA